MKIIRNGIEIELTAEERRLAYLEQQHEYDVQEVTHELECITDDLEFEDDARLAQQILDDYNKLSAVAKAKRKNQDCFDMSWGNAIQDAIDDAIYTLRRAEIEEERENE